MQQEELIEKLAEKVHKAYCKYYEVRHGKPYWTNGDYNLLDEDTKEADRVTVRAVLDSLVVDEDRMYKIYVIIARYSTDGGIANLNEVIKAIANDGEVIRCRKDTND